MELARAAGQDARVLADLTDFCGLWLFRHPDLDDAHAERAIGSGPADLSRRGCSQVLRWLELLKPVEAGAVHCRPQPGWLCRGFAAAMLGMRLSRCVSLNLRHGGLGVLDAFQNGVRVGCWSPGALESP